MKSTSNPRAYGQKRSIKAGVVGELGCNMPVKGSGSVSNARVVHRGVSRDHSSLESVSGELKMDWDYWIRRRVRLCFRNQWKRLRRRRKALIQLSVD